MGVAKSTEAMIDLVLLSRVPLSFTELLIK